MLSWIIWNKIIFKSNLVIAVPCLFAQGMMQPGWSVVPFGSWVLSKWTSVWTPGFPSCREGMPQPWLYEPQTSASGLMLNVTVTAVFLWGKARKGALPVFASHPFHRRLEEIFNEVNGQNFCICVVNELKQQGKTCSPGIARQQLTQLCPHPTITCRG